MITLHIDTSVREEIKIRLEINGKLYEKKAKNLKSQETLPLIEKILRERKIKANQINEIKVNRGPGSFTGIRVGIAIANALAFALQIPVNGKIGGELNPIYNK